MTNSTRGNSSPPSLSNPLSLTPATDKFLTPGPQKGLLSLEAEVHDRQGKPPLLWELSGLQLLVLCIKYLPRGSKNTKIFKSMSCRAAQEPSKSLYSIAD